nr:hypothetical protein [Tanacetum cinerariifolium]
MDNPDINMEKYFRYEIEKTLRNSKTYDWKTTTYVKIKYFDDINYLRFFETKFSANVSLCVESRIRSIRRIKEAQYDVLGFLGVGTTIIIFQNIPELAVNMANVFFWIRHIAHQIFMVSCEVQAHILHIFLMYMAYKLLEHQILDCFV